MVIKKVKLSEVLPIRQQILRPGKPLSECFFDEDKAKNTFHLAVYENNNLVGVTTFINSTHPFFETSTQYRLRGMAVLSECQGKKYGKQLIEEGLSILHQKNVALLWFNARAKAVGFYEKLDFQIAGNEFVIPKIGPHFLMYKKLF